MIYLCLFTMQHFYDINNCAISEVPLVRTTTHSLSYNISPLPQYSIPDGEYTNPISLINTHEFPVNVIVNMKLLYHAAKETNTFNCYAMLSTTFLINYLKRAHNCQKWKSRFLTCPCYKSFRVEAVGLPISNYTFKIMIFASM